MKKKGTNRLGFSVERVFHPNFLIQGFHMTWEETLPLNLHLLTFFQFRLSFFVFLLMEMPFLLAGKTSVTAAFLPKYFC